MEKTLIKFWKNNENTIKLAHISLVYGLVGLIYLNDDVAGVGALIAVTIGYAAIWLMAPPKE